MSTGFVSLRDLLRGSQEQRQLTRYASSTDRTIGHQIPDGVRRIVKESQRARYDMRYASSTDRTIGGVYSGSKSD